MSFQTLKIWKESNAPDFEAKKDRILELYDIADGKAEPADGGRTVVICMDEFRPLTSSLTPASSGRRWAANTQRRAGRPGVDAGSEFLAFCRYIRSLHPAGVGIAIVLDNFSSHRSTKTDPRVGDRAAAKNVQLAYFPFYGSWLNRIAAQFTALRYLALAGTDYESHRAQAPMIRRYIAWRK